MRLLTKSTVLNYLKNIVSLILCTFAQQLFIEERKKVKHNVLAWFITVIENVSQVSYFPINIAEHIYKYYYDA